jgi:signal transduction histidine kinase
MGSFGRITSQVIERALLSARAEAGELILQGRRFEQALAVIARQLRHVLDAAEVLVVMDTPRNDGLRIVCRERVDGRLAGGHRRIRPDPLVRQALRVRGPVAYGADLATIIPWASERTGVCIVRGVPGADSHDRRAAESLERFGHEIASALEMMRWNARRLQQAIDEDRSRIAGELHDGVVQTLFSVALHLQLQIGAAAEPLESSLKQAAAGIREAIQDIQQYVYDLEPSLLNAGGLESSLQQLALEFKATTGVTPALRTEPDAIAALEPVATHVLQIVREALSNVRRHAQAQSVALTIWRTPRATVMEVRDDGKGFGPEAAQGLGVRNLRSRARQLGGALALHSEVGKGSTLRLTVPLPIRQVERAVEPLPA